MYLLDTNIVSELRKGERANPGVRQFFSATMPDEVYLPVQTVGELRRGVENIRGRGDGLQAQRLEAWLDLLLDQYGDRVLGFDIDCAQVWGKLMSPNPQHPVDKQIAAIALIHDLIVVTRNSGDFADTRARVVNPFS